MVPSCHPAAYRRFSPSYTCFRLVVCDLWNFPQHDGLFPTVCVLAFRLKRSGRARRVREYHVSCRVRLDREHPSRNPAVSWVLEYSRPLRRVERRLEFGGHDVRLSRGRCKTYTVRMSGGMTKQRTIDGKRGSPRGTPIMATVYQPRGSASILGTPFNSGGTMLTSRAVPPVPPWVIWYGMSGATTWAMRATASAALPPIGSSNQ